MYSVCIMAVNQEGHSFKIKDVCDFRGIMASSKDVIKGMICTFFFLQAAKKHKAVLY